MINFKVLIPSVKPPVQTSTDYIWIATFSVVFQTEILLFGSGCRTVSNNGSDSGLAPAQNILAVQVWFGFT